MKRHIPSFRLFILCLDDETFSVFNQLRLPSVELIRLSTLESRDPLLFSSRSNRSLIEYYFTITPALILDILNQYPEISTISYLDADMYFFGSIDPVFHEMGDNSILIIEHHFPDFKRYLEVWGRFNVGYLSFRRDEEGVKCLRLWRDQCIEWCYDRLEGDRFADQKYLDTWPSIFSNIIILEHQGVNVAPWNVYNYTFCEGENGQYYVNDFPLILYHFHGVKKIWESDLDLYYDMNLNKYIPIGSTRQISGINILNNIYKEYITNLIASGNIVNTVSTDQKIISGTIRHSNTTDGRLGSLYIDLLGQIKKSLKYWMKKLIYRDIFTIRLN
jgi:hypothetical protein